MPRTRAAKERVAALVAARKGTFFDRGDGKPMKEWFTASTPKGSWLTLVQGSYALVKGR